MESAPGHGTTFSIYLPRVEAPAADPVAVIEPPSALFVDATVLFVEDDDRIRSLGAHTLRHCGYTVLTAAHATEAMALAERSANTIDLLVSDLVLAR